MLAAHYLLIKLTHMAHSVYSSRLSHCLAVGHAFLGYAPAPGANSVAPWPQPFGVPGCSTLIPFRVQFFGVRGLPPIFAPQPTTPVTFIFLLSRFALLHICIHIYICVKMYVCTYTTKCKCVHTYLYLHICVYFCI